MSNKVIDVITELIGWVVITLLLGFVNKWIWNETMPYLFGLPTITYWKMIGLTLLLKCLFIKELIIKKEYQDGRQ